MKLSPMQAWPVATGDSECATSREAIEFRHFCACCRRCVGRRAARGNSFRDWGLLIWLSAGLRTRG